MKLEDVLACVDEEEELPTSTEDEQIDCDAVLREIRSSSDTEVVRVLREVVKIVKRNVRTRIMERWVE